MTTQFQDPFGERKRNFDFKSLRQKLEELRSQIGVSDSDDDSASDLDQEDKARANP